MRLLILFITLFISFSALAATLKLEIRFKEGKVKQGTIVPATLVFDGESSQKLPLNKLVGETLGKSFYVYSAKPLITKDNWNAFESEAQVIVATIPESSPVVFKSGDFDVMVMWNEVEFIPTDAPNQMIYGEFDIPARAKIIRWGLILLALAAAVLIGMKLQKRFTAKTALKKKRALIKDEIMSVREYSEVVKVWQRKNDILKEFPSLEQNFRNLESVLFKYQFKPTQTEVEKLQVMDAWKEFLAVSQGSLNGV